MSEYLGVYSSFSAGTSRGTVLSTQVAEGTEGPPEPGKLNSVVAKTKDRQYITTQSLLDSELNVAKIRLVSTIPNKLVSEDVRGRAFVGFILTGVQESHSEKLEIVPLPGDSFASYFYGANPRQFSFSGMLLNTEQDKWRDSFEQLYEGYLRGSVSSRNYNIVQISYNGRVVSGWLTNMSQQLDSGNDHYSMFNFTVLVSRVDMAGGSKNFKDYLVRVMDGDEFSIANLDSDYAILDTTNYNAMVDPIRTGMVLPPKKPRKRKGKKKVTPDCYVPAKTTVDGDLINNGAATANTHINDATVCSAIATVSATMRKSEELFKEGADLLNKRGKDGVVSQANIDDAELLFDKASALRQGVEDTLNNKDSELSKQLAKESADVLALYNVASRDLVNPDRQAKAKAALEAGTLPVGKAKLRVVSGAELGDQKAELDLSNSAKYIRANAAALLVTAKNARTKQNKKNKEDTETNAREAATRANAQATGL
jgi:hypothetical protein